jgi:hypothetical protein
MFVRILTVALSLLLPTIAHTEDLSPFTGWWAVRTGERNFIVLHIEHAALGLSGELSRPYRVSFGPEGDAASNVSGPTAHLPISVITVSDGALTFRAKSPSNPTGSNGYRFKLDGEKLAQLSFTDFPMPPLTMSRASANASVADDWDSTTTYGLLDQHPDNLDMANLFKADQADRSVSGKIEWPVVKIRDAERRKAAEQLLIYNRLHTATDFWHASFIFQHGERPDDYLVAHTLAMISAKLGRPDAIWIAAAALDRYLQNIGKPQIFGTQFQTPHGGVATQEPYNRTLISDALRAKLNVPSLKQQEADRIDLEHRAKLK